MERVQITQSCFEFPKSAFIKSAADIEIEGSHWHAVIYATHSPDDYEVQVMLLEPFKQCLIILDHRAVRRLLLFPRGNSKNADVRQASLRV